MLELAKYLKTENETLYYRFSEIKEEAKRNFLNPMEKNGFHHSANIESDFGRIIPSTECINFVEAYIVLAAAYTHDVGYLLDGKIVSDGHERRSFDYISDSYPKYRIFNQAEADAIAQVAYAHADESEFPLAKLHTNYGLAHITHGCTADLAFCGALLRLADELQNEDMRVIGYPSQTSSIRKAIRYVDINASHWKIQIQTKPHTHDEWMALDNIRAHTQDRLTTCVQMLQKRGIYFHSILLDPDKNPFPLPSKILSAPICVQRLPSVRYGTVETRLNLPSNPETFFGRGSLLALIKATAMSVSSRTSRERGILLFGPSGVGKSSIAAKLSSSIDDCIAIDVRGDDGHFPNSFTYTVVESYLEKNKTLARESLSKASPQQCAEIFWDVSRIFNGSGRHPIIILDQFESALKCPGIIDFLVECINGTHCYFTLIFIVRSDDVAVSLNSDGLSAFERLKTSCKPLTISPFTDEEATAMCIDNNIDMANAKKYSSISRNEPWKLVRLIADRSLQINSTDDFFATDLRDLSPQAIIMLSDIAKRGGLHIDQMDSIEGGGDTKAFSTLIEKNILLKFGSRYFLYHDQFARFLLTNAPYREAIITQGFISGIKKAADSENYKGMLQLFSSAISLTDNMVTKCMYMPLGSIFQELVVSLHGEKNLGQNYHSELSAETVSVADYCTGHVNPDYLRRYWRLPADSSCVETLRLNGEFIVSDLLREPPTNKLERAVRGCKKSLLSCLRQADSFVAWGGGEANAHETAQAITALILSGIPVNDKILYSAAKYLLLDISFAQQASYAWPYYVGHSKVLPSTYTSAWCIDALSHFLGTEISTRIIIRIRVVIEWLLRVQDKKNGGWCRPDANITTVRETAAIAESLMRTMGQCRIFNVTLGMENQCEQAIELAIDYIEKSLSSEEIGFMYSHDRMVPSIHSTSYSIRALASLGRIEFLASNASTLSEFYKMYQQDHGEFGYIASGYSNPQTEATAVAIEAMCALRSVHPHDSLNAATSWLLDTQEANGGWPYGYVHQTASALRSLATLVRINREEQCQQ